MDTPKVVTFIHDRAVDVPLGLMSLDDFRRWVHSDEFPEEGRIDFLAGKVVVDMSPEDIYMHSTVKTELICVLGRRVRELGIGDIVSDRTRFSLPEADLSVEPDIAVVCDFSLDKGRVRLVPKAGGAPDRYVELEGPPDLIVEIVSDASTTKDTRDLPPAYFAGGVTELWRIDARGEQVQFEVFRRGESEFEPAEEDAEGYRYSAVLDRWYRLDRHRKPHGRLAYDLRERAK